MTWIRQCLSNDEALHAAGYASHVAQPADLSSAQPCYSLMCVGTHRLYREASIEFAGSPDPQVQQSRQSFCPYEQSIINRQPITDHERRSSRA